jgi:hypothetical protein
MAINGYITSNGNYARCNISNFYGNYQSIQTTRKFIPLKYGKILGIGRGRWRKISPNAV